MSIINIKNAFVRRTALVLAFIPMLLLVSIVYAVDGIRKGIRDLLMVTPQAWKGR